jgi:hypothetical protein
MDTDKTTDFMGLRARSSVGKNVGTMACEASEFCMPPFSACLQASGDD